MSFSLMDNRTSINLDIPKYDSLEQLAADNGKLFLFYCVALILKGDSFVKRISLFSLYATAAHLMVPAPCFSMNHPTRTLYTLYYMYFLLFPTNTSLYLSWIYVVNAKNRMFYVELRKVYLPLKKNVGYKRHGDFLV